MNPQLKIYLDRRGIEVVNEILDKKNGDKVIGYNCKTSVSENNPFTFSWLYRKFKELDLDYSIAEPYKGNRFSIYTNEA